MKRLTNAIQPATLLKTAVTDIALLKKQVAILMAEKNAVVAPLATVKTLDKCNTKELQALAEDNGIDYTDFKVKVDYIKVLKEKGLE